MERNLKYRNLYCDRNFFFLILIMNEKVLNLCEKSLSKIKIKL